MHTLKSLAYNNYGVSFWAFHYTVMFRQALKRLSDNIKLLRTHQAIVKSAYMILISESQVSITQITLETLYENLCISPRYHDCAEHIIYYIVVDLLKLDIEGDEKRVLMEQADLQTKAVLQSREIKFIELLTSLSYMTKETLVGAKVLAKSVKRSKEDAAELISSSVQSGDLIPTVGCLKKLMKSVTSDSLCKQIKAILDAPEWVEPDSVLKMNVTLKTVKTSRHPRPDIVEPDSPKSQDVKVLEAPSPGKMKFLLSNITST